MKIQFKQSAIIEAISHACTVIPTKSTMPIIRNLKLQAKDGELIIFATDSEVELTIKIKNNISVKEDGEILIDGGKFRTILQEIGEGDFELLKENNSVIINGVGCEFSINSVRSEEYPIFESFEGEPTFEISGISLKTMFEKTVFATRDEPSRYQMNGVLLKGDGTSFDVVATDTKRLALVNRKLDSQTNVEDVNCILSTKFVNTLMKTIPDTTVQVKIEGNRIKVKSANLTISSKLVNGIFPDYKKAIPVCDLEVKVNKNLLLAAIRKTTIFTSEITRSIKFSFQNNVLLLHSSMPESGEAHISLEIEYSGAPIEMNFNPTYVQDGLKVMNNEEIIIELKDPKRPAIIKGDVGYVYLVMPVLAREA